MTFVVPFCLEIQLQMSLFKVMKVHLKKKAKDLCMTDANHNSAIARGGQEQHLLRTFVLHQPRALPCSQPAVPCSARETAHAVGRVVKLGTPQMRQSHTAHCKPLSALNT